MPVYFLQFEGTPQKDHPDSDEIGGAIIDCWLLRSNQEKAKQDALSLIRDDGWIVDEPDLAFEDDQTNYETDSPQLQYFEQVLTDREVLVFHTYPIIDGEG